MHHKRHASINLFNEWHAGTAAGVGQTFLVMGLTTALWVSVALLTEPDPRPVLDEFYRRARPLGSWGPVRATYAANAASTGTSAASAAERRGVPMPPNTGAIAAEGTL